MRNRRLANAILGFVGASTAILVILNFYALALFYFHQFPSVAQESIVGIGVKLDMYKVSLIGQDQTAEPLGLEVEVKEVLPNSPAKSAGLMVGDYIIAINGQNSGRMEYDEVVNLIRGEEGTYAELEILRFLNSDKGGEIDLKKDFAKFNLKIKREKIKTN